MKYTSDETQSVGFVNTPLCNRPTSVRSRLLSNWHFPGCFSSGSFRVVDCPKTLGLDTKFGKENKVLIGSNGLSWAHATAELMDTTRDGSTTAPEVSRHF